MLWQYLGLLFSFAFRRTTLAIDSLQIVAASAIPALSQLVGFKMAPNIQNETLAYIGAAAIAWVVLRLICAPYFIWRDQSGEVAALRLELSKPERLELARLAEIRAEAKAQLAELVGRIMFTAAKRKPERDGNRLGQWVDAGISLSVRANASRSFDSVFARFAQICYDIVEAKERPTDLAQEAIDLANAMQSYLHGELTAEALGRLLPPNTEPEKQP